MELPFTALQETVGGNFAILGRDEESDYVDVFGKDYSKNVKVGL